jgi:DNA-binding transcriptional LysR family regulator
VDRFEGMSMLLAVVDNGSFSAASRALGVPVVTLSRKVSDLETRLGSQLLIRNTRKLTLTDAGQGYVASARRILEQLDEAEREAVGEYKAPRGELTVTTSVQLGAAVVVPLVTEFLQQHPEITLNLLLLERRVQLIDERVDLGVRIGNLNDSSLCAVRVGDVYLTTCASPDYVARKGRPARPEDLPGHDSVIFGRANEPPWLYSRDGIQSHGMPHVLARVNAATAAVIATTLGLGITRVLDFMVDDRLRSGELVRLLEDYDGGSFPVHVVWVPQGLLPRKVRAFLDWMTPRLRERLRERPTSPPSRK